MNVLVIPEDFRKDQYLLKPIIAAMFDALQRPARVEICLDPLLGGVEQALSWRRIQDIIEQYAWKVHLFLICVDRDGKEGRRTALDHLEQKAATTLPGACTLLGENAWQEIEVWALAGQDLPGNWNWSEIRSDPNAKETFFLPYVRQRGLLEEPGEGRKQLGIEAARRYGRVRQLCPEDVAALEQRIARWLDSRRVA